MKSMLSILVLMFWLCGCKKEGTVLNLFRFPQAAEGSETKDVSVQINIDFKLASAIGPNLDLTGEKFILSAYALDAAGKQVKVAVQGGEPSLELAITMPASHYTFAATLRIPQEVEPRTTGYAFRFELKSAPGLTLADDTGSEMSALHGDVQAGTAAQANRVDLSLATTLAARLVRETISDPGAAPAIASYVELKALLSERLRTIEASADAGKIPSAVNYLKAVGAALKLQLLKDQTLQRDCAARLSEVTKNASEEEKSAAAQFLADGLAKSLVLFAVDVQTQLGDITTSTSKVFPSTYIDIATLPKPDHYDDAILAPVSVSFSDTDSTETIGGNVAITLPLLTSGITGFRVYLGGRERPASRALLLGETPMASAPSYLVPNGTSVPPGASRIWVFPMAGAKELDLPQWTPLPPSTLTAVTGNLQALVTWTGFATTVTSSNLYWSTTSPVSKSSDKILSATSPYSHMGLTAGVSYFYAVSIVDEGIESGLSPEAAVTVTSTPAPIAPSIAYPNGIARFLVNNATTVTPVIAGTGPLSFGISPALSPGLTLNTATGAISGTPTSYRKKRNYTVTVTGSGGTASTPINLDVYNSQYWGGTENTAVVANASTVYVGGPFKSVGEVIGYGATFDAGSGTQPESKNWPEFFGVVRAAIEDPNEAGALYVGGSFERVGAYLRRYLVRLRPDGSVDPAFDAAIDAGNYYVAALAIDSTHLFVGGKFTTLGGVGQEYLASVDRSTGNLNTTFTADPDGEVTSLALAGSELFVGCDCSFTGTSTAKFTTLTSSTGTQVSGSEFGANGIVRSLLVDGSILYVAGEFSNVTDGSNSHVRNKIAAYDLTTDSVVAGFDPGANGTVNALAVSGSTLYFGGSFSTAGGASRTRLAAVAKSNGSIQSWAPPASGVVRALGVTGSRLFVGGDFATIDSVANPFLTAFDTSTGTMDSNFVPKLDGSVRAISKVGDKVFAGGSFVTAYGVARQSLAAFDRQTGEPTSFNALLPVGAQVNDLALSGATLYVGGQFATIGGVARINLASVDATSGALNSPFNAQISTNQTVTELAALGSKLYVAGNFTSIGGQSLSRFAVLNSTSANADVGSPVVNAAVEVLRLSSDGTRLYMGGRFDQVDATTRTLFAELDTSTDALTSRSLTIGGTASNGVLAVFGMDIEDGLLYLAGDFDTVLTDTRRGVVAINLGTNTVTSFDAHIDAGGWLNEVGVGAAEVYLGVASAGIDFNSGVDHRGLTASVLKSSGALGSWITPGDRAINDIFRLDTQLFINHRGHTSVFQ